MIQLVYNFHYEFLVTKMHFVAAKIRAGFASRVRQRINLGETKTFACALTGATLAISLRGPGKVLTLCEVGAFAPILGWPASREGGVTAKATVTEDQFPLPPSLTRTANAADSCRRDVVSSKLYPSIL